MTFEILAKLSNASIDLSVLSNLHSSAAHPMTPRQQSHHLHLQAASQRKVKLKSGRANLAGPSETNVAQLEAFARRLQMGKV